MGTNGSTPAPQVRLDTANLLVEVAGLRVRGDAARGGPAADDQVSAAVWVERVAEQVVAAKFTVLQMASGMVSAGGQAIVAGGDLDSFRAHLLAAAELALSAVESLDRIATYHQAPGRS